jgi:RNA polymerase sigma-70 factor, ECF subfamily
VAAAKAALAALRPAEREVFALCVWSGLDYATAAEALGVPVGTVRSRLSRARTKLRALAERALPPTPAPPAAPPGPAPPGARESAPPAARESAPPAGREPAPLPGQVQGGRATAARSNQEMNR